MIVLPWPAKPLWPNFRSRTHWAKTRAVKAARADGYYATKAARIGIPAGDIPITLNIEFTPPDNRHRDRDNLLAACKAQIDGIADALGIDDKAFRYAPIIVLKAEKPGKVVVTIGEPNLVNSDAPVESGDSVGTRIEDVENLTDIIVDA